MECVYERINEREFCERTQLIEWKAAALLERGKFLPLLYNWTTKKFVCTANFAVSSKSNSIACLSPDGELNIMQMANNKMVLKSQVRVLLDPYPEFRLIEWNQSETLLLATRSTAVVDVFEAQGMFLYKIPMKEESQGSSQIVSQIRLHALENDENFSDDVYTLQIDGTLSAFRVGKSAYHRLFTTTLSTPPLCSLAFVPKFGILITSGEFQRQNHSTETMDSANFGLSVYRRMDAAPFVECIKETNTKKAWHERIPFLSDKRAVITDLAVSPEQKSLMAVTSNGDLLWLALPSLRLMQSTSSLDDKFVPTQVSWVSEESFVVLHSNGQISRANPDDYFRGEYEDRRLNLLENCKRICTVDDSTAFAMTEVRLDNIVAPEENKQRVGAELSLFVIFHLSFFMKLLKAFFSFFFGGDATADLSEKLGVEQSAHLTLYTTRTLSLAQYIEKCLNDRNYELAITLADSVPDAYDLDLVYKRQWAGLKAEKGISEEHVEVLRCVHDGQWVLEECLRLDVHDLKLHGRVLSLAQVVVEGVQNERLAQRVQNAIKIMNIVRRAIPRDEEACEMYLRNRHSTLLDFAFAIAEDAQFVVLATLLEVHAEELRNYLLVVLAAIPENAQPKGYAHLLPYCQHANIPDGLAFVLNRGGQKFRPASIALIPQRHSAATEFILGLLDSNEEELFERWCAQRAELIDAISGINEDCVGFLDAAIEHGCEGLKELKRKYELYGTFVRFGGSINLSFKQFLQSDAPFVQSTLSKHMSRKMIVENFKEVIQLIEFADGDRGKAAEQILQLVREQSARSFDVLNALKAARPELLTADTLTQCFLGFELNGEALIAAMREFGVQQELVVVVELCSQLPRLKDHTFADFHAATADPQKARALIREFVSGSCAAVKKPPPTDEWWRELLARARQLRRSAFEAAVGDEEVLRFVCGEMLESVCRHSSDDLPASRQAPFHLVVDLSGTAASAKIPLLKQSAFEELIVEKSQQFLDSAMADLADANLRRAAHVLDAVRTGTRAPRSIAAQRRAIDVVRASLELGSRRIPATFAHCSKEMLLSEVVGTKNNYKNVKACADLAKLLELSTPSARALAGCASCALERNDTPTLKNYVRQLAKSARDFAVVYEMAKAILERQLDDEDLQDDALACLLHNCPEDDLNVVFELLAAYRSRKAQHKAEAAEGNAREAADVQSFPDPNYTPIQELYRYDFSDSKQPVLPVHTHQTDVILAVEGDLEAIERVHANPDLYEPFAALKHLQEVGVHPFVLENLQERHFRQLAARSSSDLKPPKTEKDSFDWGDF
ncbi:Neuroblastoma-amplified sequence [Aphelenchoides fujianensis]|nr:Neuroblastoma-amplified sequence [Aphelenchoides fujianensis]